MDYVRLSETSFWPRAAGDWLMGVFKGYFDESGAESDPQHYAMSFAGYLTTVEDWSAFEDLWKATLDRHQVDYLHLKELHGRRKIYKKWKDNPEAVKEFLSDIIQVIAGAKLEGFSATVLLPDLDRINRERGRKIGAYSLCIYSCMRQITQVFNGKEAEITIDKLDMGGTKIDVAKAYAAGDSRFHRIGLNQHWRALDKNSERCSKNLRPLQAADFIAWELRKSYELKKPWYEKIRPSVPPERYEESLLWWSLLNRANGSWPAERTSLQRLFDASKTKEILWDYRTLCLADDERGGRWGVC